MDGEKVSLRNQRWAIQLNLYVFSYLTSYLTLILVLFYRGCFQKRTFSWFYFLYIKASLRILRLPLVNLLWNPQKIVFFSFNFILKKRHLNLFSSFAWNRSRHNHITGIGLRLKSRRTSDGFVLDAENGLTGIQENESSRTCMMSGVIFRNHVGTLVAF